MCPSAKSVIRAAALCLAAFLPAMQGARAQDVGVRQRVAVFEPEESLQKGQKPQLTPIQKSIIWGALEEGLVSTGRYTFLDRSRIGATMKELTTQRNFDIYSQEGRKEFQSRLAADLICVTSVTVDKKAISLRSSIMDVATGEIEHSASEYIATKKEEEVREAVIRLAAKIIPASSMTREQARNYAENCWKRTGRLDSSDSFVRDGHVYRVINKKVITPKSPRFFFVARDDDKEWKKFSSPGVGSVVGLSLFVAEGGDIYASGYTYEKGDGSRRRGVVWKNGAPMWQGNSDAVPSIDYVWAWEDDVYTVSAGALWLNRKKILP